MGGLHGDSSPAGNNDHKHDQHEYINGHVNDINHAAAEHHDIDDTTHVDHDINDINDINDIDHTTHVDDHINDHHVNDHHINDHSDHNITEHDNGAVA